MTETKNRFGGNQAASNGNEVFLNGYDRNFTMNNGKSQPLNDDDLNRLLDKNFQTSDDLADDDDEMRKNRAYVRAGQVEPEPKPEQPAEDAVAAEEKPFFEPMSLDDLLALPPKEWVIDQVLGKGDLGMVYGGPGSGKTFVVIDLIFAACSGQQWAMRFDVVRPLNVAYAAGEGVSGLPARFAAAKQHFGVERMPNFTFFKTVPQMFSGDNTPYAGRIQQFVDEWKKRQEEGEAQPLDILIIDTLHSATAGADENSAQHMGIVLNLAKYAAQELGCAVLLVHHTNKAGTGERGSSALRGAMDVMIEIKRPNEDSTRATMTCAKLKDGEKWKDQAFDLVEMGESVRVWWYEPSDSIVNNKLNSNVDEIIELLKTEPGQRWEANRIAEAIGLGGSKQIFRFIKDAMRAEERIKTSLKDSKKDASSRNPMVYWFQTESQSVISQSLNA